MHWPFNISGTSTPSLVCIKDVSGTAPPAVKSNSAARRLHTRLNTPPRLHQTPPLNPHANRETYSGHTSVHERSRIKRNTGRAPNTGQAPTVRPLFTRGQTDSGQESHPSAAPHLLLHHFLHSSDGFPGAMLRHTTRLGGPPSPPDTGEAARCFINLAWPDGASCRPNSARGSATHRSGLAR